MSEDPSAVIEAWVRERGPVTFAAFMDRCLHDPVVGYYSRNLPGPRGDFVTAPTLSPVFGRCIARCLEAMWAALGHPDPFVVTEPGGGDGSLAASVFASLVPEAAAALRWRFVEPHAVAAERQRERVGDASWSSSLEELDPALGCVVANEVVDSFGAHLLEVVDGRLRELRVAAEGGGLRFVDSDPDPQVAAYAQRYELGEGQRLEVRLGVGAWVRQAAAVLDRGYLLVIDYGHEAEVLYSSRPEGTLLAYRGGRPTDDVLDTPGQQDLTAHVDFTALRESARESGLRHVSTDSQRDFLIRWGLRRDLEELLTRAQHATGAEALHLHAHRGAAALLAGSMGTFRVLLMSRNAPDPDAEVVET